MDATGPIADDEILLRHIPGGTAWQAPPDDRVTSFNFSLREGELGISVSRAGITPPARLMARLGDPTAGSKIAALSAADVRAVGLDVVPAPLDDDPGHAEIRSAAASLDRKSVRRRLADLCRYVGERGARLTPAPRESA